MLIVIPAANEENRIAKTLNELLQEIPPYYKILVVSNGDDKTANIIKKISQKNNCVKLIDFDRKIGKGKAIIEGLKQVNEIAAFYDADGATPPEELMQMEKTLNAGADIVICSRNLPTSKTSKRSLKRTIASRAFNLIVRILFGLTYKDTQCGAKAFSEKARKWIVNQKWISTGFEWDVEMLVRAQRAGFKIVEIPITWNEQSNGTLKDSDIIKIGKGLLKLKTALG